MGRHDESDQGMLLRCARRICISPQCGFASVYEGNPISEEVRMTSLWLKKLFFDELIRMHESTKKIG